MDHEAEDLLTETRPVPRFRKLSVIRNQAVAEGTYLLTLDAGEETVPVEPGQFFMVGFPGVRDPLLPRPFAAFDLEAECLEVLYQRIGVGTGLLAQVQAGAVLQVFGPLGRGYRMLRSPGKRSLLVCGGIGFASVHLLLKRLLAAGRPVTMLYGTRSQGGLYRLHPGLGAHRCLALHVATEDGGEGYMGNVHDLWRALQERDPAFASRHDAAALCGPLPMLRALAPDLRAHGLSVQVSLEANMACGYGVCQGCVVPAGAARRGVGGGSKTYRKVCTDGPVFSIDEVDWDAMG